jgi:hypothetical protein|tara:strand:+ start:212 stop:403 length:192 start_codon:yes stop_codon:yes gene_type:complete
MNKLLILSLLVLSGCSNIGIASLSSNIVTYNITGKTNADHAISMLMQRDCEIKRVLNESEICK